MGLSAIVELNASGNNQTNDGIGTVVDTVRSGQGSFPAMSMLLSDGNLAGQANKWHRSTRTIAAGANLDLDLAGGLTDSRGNTLTFTRIVGVIVAVVSPDGTKAVRVGPNGVTNAWQGPFGGVGAGNYLTTKYWLPLIDYSTGGFSVTAGTGDILRISNPGGSAVDIVVWVIGS